MVVDRVLVRHANACVPQHAGFVNFRNSNPRTVQAEVTPVGVPTISVVVGIHTAEIVDLGEAYGGGSCYQTQHEHEWISQEGLLNLKTIQPNSRPRTEVV